MFDKPLSDFSERKNRNEHDSDWCYSCATATVREKLTEHLTISSNHPKPAMSLASILIPHSIFSYSRNRVLQRKVILSQQASQGFPERTIHLAHSLQFPFHSGGSATNQLQATRERSVVVHGRRRNSALVPIPDHLPCHHRQIAPPTI
jgi:hypothetical protein